MYSNKFVCSVMINGEIQKELANGEIHLGFGESYSLRLRNRHNREAAVQIFIDGENVSGAGYRIPANDKIDIRRWIDKDKAFKFVDLDSQEAADFGKNGPNYDKTKGVIEARFFLVKEKPKVEHHYHPYSAPQPYPIYPVWPKPPWHPFYGSHYCHPDSYKIYMNDCCSGTQGAQGDGGLIGASLRATSCSPTMPSYNKTLKEGATVEGHATGQSFSSVFMDLEKDYVSIKVFLKGYTPDVAVINECRPSVSLGGIINTGEKFCTNCGENRLSTAKFCGNCGVKLGPIF